MIYMPKKDWEDKIKKNIFNSEFDQYFDIFCATRKFIHNLFPEKLEIYIAACTLIFIHKFIISSEEFSLKESSKEDLYYLFGASSYISQISLNCFYKSKNDISTYIQKLNETEEPLKKIDINDINKKLNEKEFDILCSIGFNCNIELPFFNLSKIKDYLSKFKFDQKKFFTLLNYLVQDSYILPICLFYTPNTINISSIQFLIDKSKLNFIKIQELIQLTGEEIDEEEVKQCTNLIKQIEDNIIKRAKSKDIKTKNEEKVESIKGKNKTVDEE